MSTLNPAYIDMLVAFQRQELSRAEQRMQRTVSQAKMSQRTADFVLDRMDGVLRVLESLQTQTSPPPDPGSAESDDNRLFDDATAGGRT